VRVLDVTRFYSGPFSTLMLAGFGAEIIRIYEPRRGDPTMTGPPFLGTSGVSPANDGWLLHDCYAATIKAPNEVEEPWDYYNILRTIPPRMRHNHCRKAAAHSYAIQLIAANIYGDDA